MKAIIGLVFFCFVICFSVESKGVGVVVTAAPAYWSGYLGGYPYACGFRPIVGWPAVTAYPYYQYFYGGFTYVPYYTYYQPYIPTYGAISYSAKDDKVGWAWGESNRDRAAQASVDGCGSDDCQPVVWVQGGCAALATSKTTKALGWSYANSKHNATRTAMKSCRASGGADCEPRAWVCAW